MRALCGWAISVVVPLALGAWLVIAGSNLGPYLLGMASGVLSFGVGWHLRGLGREGEQRLRADVAHAGGMKKRHYFAALAALAALIGCCNIPCDHDDQCPTGKCHAAKEVCVWP